MASNLPVPKGARVVPFGITLEGSKYEPQKGTAMEPMGRATRNLFARLGASKVALNSKGSV